MLFKDYKHIELLEDGISISASRVANNKLAKVKNWKPTNPYRLRVKATVRRGGKRTIKKRTFVYQGIYMVDALRAAERELDTLLSSIRDEINASTIIVNDDRESMMTFGTAFVRSLQSRKMEAEANGGDFKTYNQSLGFYDNYLKVLEPMPLDQITSDTLNTIRANMKHKNGTPFSARTKLAVLQQVNPVYNWFNEYSKLTVKSPARIKKSAVRNLNTREVKVDDISPLFNAMYNYPTLKYRHIFIWLMHGRRVSEVLNLRWENINLKRGTYTITAQYNKAGIDMTYKLTSYQLDTLQNPKRKGVVFPAGDGVSPLQNVTLRLHWLKVRKKVGSWTLNGKEGEELHTHDIRHLLASEMLNKYGVVDEISGAALGHTRKGITGRYAEILSESVHNATVQVLDGVFKDVL